MNGLVELLDYLDAHDHFVLSCMHASGHGDFSFCGLFHLPNVGQGYHVHYSLCHCNSLSANLAQ